MGLDINVSIITDGLYSVTEFDNDDAMSKKLDSGTISSLRLNIMGRELGSGIICSLRLDTIGKELDNGAISLFSGILVDDNFANESNLS